MQAVRAQLRRLVWLDLVVFLLWLCLVPIYVLTCFISYSVAFPSQMLEGVCNGAKPSFLSRHSLSVFPLIFFIASTLRVSLSTLYRFRIVASINTVCCSPSRATVPLCELQSLFLSFCTFRSRVRQCSRGRHTIARDRPSMRVLPNTAGKDNV